MDNSLKKILEETQKWQKTIDQAKLQKANWEGKLSEITRELSEKFSVTSLEEAASKRKEIEEYLEALEKQIIELRDTIKKEYDL